MKNKLHWHWFAQEIHRLDAKELRAAAHVQHRQVANKFFLNVVLMLSFGRCKSNRACLTQYQLTPKTTKMQTYNHAQQQKIIRFDIDQEATTHGTRNGTLYIRIAEARNLLAKDDGGVSDPFCTGLSVDVVDVDAC